MKYILLITLLLTTSPFFVNGQGGLVRTSVYEEGDEIKSYEDNFKNLKVNWSRIANHSEIEILSCDYAYTFENEKQIIRYAGEQSQLASPNFTMELQSFMSNGKMIETIKVRVFTFQEMIRGTSMVKKGQKNQFLSQLEIRRKEIINKVKIGDRVYVISYKMNGKVCKDYVVCSAADYKIICDNQFKNVSFRRGE